MMRYALGLALVMGLTGCFAVPPDTYPLSGSPQYVEIAERVADLVDAPERCRDWDEVGVHYAWTQEDMHASIGICGPVEWASDGPPCPVDGPYRPGGTYYWVQDDAYDSLIVLAGDQTTPTLGHEVLHHIMMCMYGHGPEPYQSGDNSHDHPVFWDLVSETLMADVCAGERSTFIDLQPFGGRPENPPPPVSIRIRCEDE